MIRTASALLLALLAFGSSAASAGNALWLSDISPHAGHGHGGHAHGGPVIKRRGVYYKQLWLRHGENPGGSGYVQEVSSLSPLLLLDTAGQLSEIPVLRDEDHGLYHVEFPMPEEGFYNAYLIHQWADAGERLVQIAKAEVLKHSCREGHDNVQEKMPPQYSRDIPLEIVRQRVAKENFHTLLGHGDSISFQVLHNGKPQAGAEVTFTTAKGWSKSSVSDSEGRVRYTLIRDYYPQWELFNKRQPEPYVVSAVYTLPEVGELNGETYRRTAYRTSFAGNYYPSPRDYESYAYGLSFGLLALLLSGIGIYIYRRRRQTPYREVRFDD